MRLFFLCGKDYSLAECGPGGQGYELKEFVEWVKKVMPVAKLMLVLSSIALKTCIGLAIPVIDFENAFGKTFEGVFRTIAEEGSKMLMRRRALSGMAYALIVTLIFRIAAEQILAECER